MTVLARSRAISLILRRLRMPLLVLIVAYAVGVVGFVLVPGQDHLGQPFHLDFFHAFYVVTYTITTIGFGELPYSFSEAQRLWMIVTIYLGVIAWAYAIGAIISFMQDPALRQAIRRSSFARSVGRLNTPFYLICGYGDTGSLVVRDMIEHGLSAVVLESDQDRINELMLEERGVYVPGLCADAGHAANLELAGLSHELCAGVIAITNDDAMNLRIGMAAKLLNRRLRVIGRAELPETRENMEACGIDVIIDPFDAFAERLALALHAPEMQLVYEWLTQTPGQPLPARLHPPHGAWVLAGFGRFGKAVYHHMGVLGISTTIIERDPEGAGAPEGTVVGRGYGGDMLKAARIEEAVGIVAGTDDDAVNLSLAMTARELKPDLFLVARQNAEENDALFRAAKIDLVVQSSHIMANRILAHISTPLLTDFLHLARFQNKLWALHLLERLLPLLHGVTPDLWNVTLTPEDAPAVAEALLHSPVRLGILVRDPGRRERRLPCLPLLLRRGDLEFLIPDDDLALSPGDSILVCGPPGTLERMQWALRNPNVLRYLLTGDTRPQGGVWEWLARRTQASEPGAR
jgi:voltage-gated potassium channel